MSDLDLHDIQGNVLRGVRAGLARHFMLSIGDPAAASRFLATLVPGADDDGLKVSTAAEWAERPPYFLNVGLTHDGLAALGLPADLLKAFPTAFRRGPAYRGPDPDDPTDPATIDVPAMLGDTDPADAARGVAGPGDPSTWAFGNPAGPPVHVVVSLYTDYSDEVHAQHLFDYSAKLRALFAAHALTEQSHHDARALPGGEVHFGYRDGIAQPRVDGAPGRTRADMQPASTPGEFLLGRDYRNQYDGNFLGALPNALGDNATYGALRMVKQDVAAFERFLRDAGARANMHPELVAAKLMGRWRNGKPLTLAPDDPETPVPEGSLNDFDYAPTKAHPTYYDDADGLRCPIGAHARRLNPRGSLVMGKPHSRRIIRRGMPYGAKLDPTRPDDGVERGLLGYFLCGDIESQFEFLQATWANKDYATSGLRGTRDPIVGGQGAAGGTFTIRTDDGRDPIVLGGLPRWVTARGAAYTFLPGIGGLRWLGARGWEQEAALQPHGYPTVAERVAGGPAHPTP